MKILYDNSDKSIQIKDGLKKSYLMLKILLVLNLTNAIIRLVGRDKVEYGAIEYFWIAIGIISLVVLYFFVFKISTAEKIQVDEISSIKQQSVLGRKRYTFALTNGKKRHLGHFRSENEFAKFNEIVKTAGIQYG